MSSPLTDSSMRARDFDTVIVGTSPVALIEALHLGREGKRVLLVDMADRAGGAWSTTESGPFRRVELGPHLIKPRSGLYELIGAIELGMHVMRPQPKRVMAHPLFGVRLVPLNWSWLDDRSTAFRRAPLWRKPLILARIAVTLIRRVLGFGPPVAPIRYPRGGSQAIVDRLCALAREVGAEVRLATKITGVEVDTEQGIVRVRHGDTVVVTDEFVFTSGTKLSDVMIDGRRVDFDDPPQKHTELLLLLEDDGRRRFSFVKMTDDDPLMFMSSDITPYTHIDDAAAERPLRSVSVRLREGWPATSDTAGRVVAGLAGLGLIGANARVVHHRWIELAIPYRRTERIEELSQACGPCIRGLYTYDLGMALLAQRERWRPTLDWLRRRRGGARPQLRAAREVAAEGS